MIRLGCSGQLVGQPDATGSRSGSATHLSLSLARLGDALTYLERLGVRYYRFGPALNIREVYAQLGECAALLEALAERVVAAGVRLCCHLAPGLDLGVADNVAAAEALVEVEAHAALLAALDARRSPGPPEGIVVAHLSSAAADERAGARFAARYAALSPRARARLALEHGHAGPSLGRLLEVHQRCGVPIVFDMLHWELHNPEGLALPLALGLALATWPGGLRPEVHLSSQRSEAHVLPPRPPAPARILPPRPGQHADFVAIGDLERLLRAAAGLPPFDLMIEARAGELALLRLRAEISRHAPALAAMLG
ncbi:MAG: UV damage endonuclease UvsE [Oscillochloridaceae bacterium]|nr:UV damage endonuclease UvsE [Chloroflexaceae bacterium]MDW8391935.1 UV damage endonuclease UvsE [Oscillochloridaceae bacterium]